MPNIYFGIPGERNVVTNIEKWMSIAGPPDIFAEKEENLDKHQRKLLGRYDVVSIEEALGRYPGAHVWVTFRRAGISADRLIKVLPPERIHFLEADLEYRKGCKYLGRFISYRKDTFSPCCVTGRCPIVQTSGTVRDRLAQWRDYTTQLVDDIRNDRPNACQYCHLLQFGAWRKTIRLDEINFGSNQPGDVCNFRCTYCFCENTFKRLKDSTDGLTTYEVLRQISEMPEYDREDFIVQLANGEFCANKYCDEMLDVLLKTRWSVELLSNMSIYKEKLATLMNKGRVVSLLVSIDAGTRETFKAIKRVDMFDKVVENLSRYPVNKTRLLAKYIFLDGVNDNEADVDGFYGIVKNVRGTISLSSDLNKPYTDKMREMALRMIKKAKVDGISLSTGNSYLALQDAKFINDSYASALTYIPSDAARNAGGEGGAGGTGGTGGAGARLRIGFLGYQTRPTARARCLFALASLYDVEFFYFSPECVDMENRRINATFSRKGEYYRREVDYPDIIDDVAGLDTTHKELYNHLRANSLLTYTPLGGKSEVYDILQASEESLKYCVETFSYEQVDIDDILDRYKKVIIKPIFSNKGVNIYRLRKENRYYMLELLDKEYKLSPEQYKEQYARIFTGSYIVQRYIHSRTNAGCQFDIRVDVRRGRDAKWQVVKVYPQIGVAGVVNSNIVRGGTTTEIEYFLPYEFGENWENVYRGLLRLGREIPPVIQRNYDRLIDAVGIDVGIDRWNNNELKIFEVNTNPWALPFQFEAAESSLHYYQYLAKKGILAKDL